MFIKHLYIFIFLCVLTIQVSAQNYKKVVINLSTKQDYENLALSGIAVDHFEKLDDSKISLFVSDYEIEILKKLDINYEIEIDNWNEYSKNIPSLSPLMKSCLLKESNNKFNIDGFNFGSMNSCLTFDEVITELDSLREEYPNLISEKFSIGKSIEDRDQWVVKISDNPDIDEDEPQVLYTALIHAREPASMMTLFYFMHYLLSNYGTNPEVAYLVDNREFYFLPVINPDGYEYNHYLHTRTESPVSKPMWRKNKRDNNNDSEFDEMYDGVDLNRNFSYMWAYNDYGSSGSYSSATFRGDTSFSEPETYNIKTFVESKNFKTCLNYHSYGNLLLIPWNFTTQPTPDSAIFNQYASEMTAYNKYEWGSPANILYSVNGDTDDWFYGEQTTKEKVIAMTPELGKSSDHFWPSAARILVIAEENIFPNLYVAWAAGDFDFISKLSILTQSTLSGNNIELEIVVSNKGLESSDKLSLEFYSESAFIDIKEKLILVNDIPPRDSVFIAVNDIISINSSAESDSLVEIIVRVKKGDLVLDEETIHLEIDSPTSAENETKIYSYKLEQNYPNPFNPTTNINYSIAQSGKVLLQVFDIGGKLVSELVNHDQLAGNYQVKFSANNLASGIYFYKISVNNFVETKKLLLLK